MTPDVNVLVAAYRDDHTYHGTARLWLSEALATCATGGTLEILPMVAAGFVRVVTNRKVFPIKVTPTAEAMAFLRSIAAVRGVVMPQLGAEWSRFEKLCVDLGLKGNDIPDAWIAAAVSVGGFHLVTFDADFARLLRPSEYTLLRPGIGVKESRGRYAVRQTRRKRR